MEITKAHSLVSKAVRNGELPSLGELEIDCVDCGARATCYDHRDYDRPLDVEPVCQSCNVRRGSGKNGIEPKCEVIKIDKDVLDRCRKVAHNEGRTLSGLIRVLLLQALSNERGRNGRQ